LRRPVTLVSALLFPIFTWWLEPPKPVEVHIAVSGNIREVMMEVAQFHETRNPNLKVKLFFGTAEEIAAQVENHAPLDVYIGDEDDLALLKEKEMLDGAPVPLFMNQVLAIAASDSDWEITDVKQVTPENVKRVALPKENSKAGRRTREYLKKLGLLDALKDKITEVKSPKAAVDSIKDGEAKWAFVYSTEYTRRKGLKVLWKVPPEDLPPMRFSAVRLKSNADPEKAQRVLAALQTSIVRKFFENAGFSLLVPPVQK
jgi:molybdenum ABC transporter molybdate-binding protein